MIFRHAIGHLCLILLLQSVKPSFGANKWCQWVLGTLVNGGQERLDGTVPHGNRSWLSSRNPLNSTSEQLNFLIKVLLQHPNIVTTNLKYRRSFLDTLSHIPILTKQLGVSAAPMQISPPRVIKAKYISQGELKYNEEAIRLFKEERIRELGEIQLLDNSSLCEHLEYIKKTSLGIDGRFSDKLFRKRVSSLYRVLPFLIESDGEGDLGNLKIDKVWSASKIREATPQDLDNWYENLFKEKLEKAVDSVASKSGLGQLRVLFESTRNQCVGRELKKITTPILESGKNLEKRTLSLESLPAPVAVLRGCYGGDCSILSVPFYSLLKGTRTYFIRNSDDLDSQPVGYVFVADAKVYGKIAPFIITINGSTLTKSDVEVAVRLVAKDYHTTTVLLPDFVENYNLVNSSSIRHGMHVSSAKKVPVALPKGWNKVDRYTNIHNRNEYLNYYDSSRLGTAYLATLPIIDQRVIGSVESFSFETSRYNESKDLIRISPMERAVLGAQVLSDDGCKVSQEHVLTLLEVSEAQISAATPLIQLSPDRPLRYSEYEAAKKYLGYGLKDILKLKLETRSAILKALYEEEPKLYYENSQFLASGRYIEGLATAFALNKTELVKKVVEAQDLSESEAFTILRNLKEAIDGSIVEIGRVRLLLRYKASETNILGLLRDALLSNSYSQTRLGIRLLDGLNSLDPLVRDFYERVLEEMTPSIADRFPVLCAIREIERIKKSAKLTIEEAERSWLSSLDIPAGIKASFLVLKLTSNRYQELYDMLPESQTIQVKDALHKRSSFLVFLDLARTLEGKAKLMDAKVNLLNASLESFEFESIAFPQEGKKVTLGSHPGDEHQYGNEAQVEVKLTRPFEIQATATTNFQYMMYLKATGRNPKKLQDLETKSLREPVVYISWSEAESFALWLSELDPIYNYRLPTSSEWEYSARGGTTTSYSFTGGVMQSAQYAWTSENAGKRIHPVALKKPNPFGLYDMHGNQWEWTLDWYAHDPPGGLDPTGPTSGSQRVIRGGCWANFAHSARSAVRGYVHPESRITTLGFRLVRTLK